MWEALFLVTGRTFGFSPIFVWSLGLMKLKVESGEPGDKIMFLLKKVIPTNCCLQPTVLV